MTLVITPDSVIKQSRLADFVEILNIKISISVAKRYHTVQSSLLLLIANENQPLGSKNYSHFQSKKKKTPKISDVNLSIPLKNLILIFLSQSS